MAERSDSTEKLGGSQSGNPWPRLATLCSWERQPNSDQMVGPVMVTRRRIASPAVKDGLTGVVFVLPLVLSLIEASDISSGVAVVGAVVAPA